MSDYFRKLMDSIRRYSIFDFGVFKIMLVTLGILLGLYFPIPLFRIIWLIIPVFVLSYVWIIYITFFRR